MAYSTSKHIANRNAPHGAVMEGARSVLVLEENDLSSTNHQLVAEAMARAEAGRPDTLWPPGHFATVGVGNYPDTASLPAAWIL